MIYRFHIVNFLFQIFINNGIIKSNKAISSKLRENHDLILTVGFEEIQSKKIEACGLSHINYKIVQEYQHKIIEMAKYIINDLGFIPHKITIYEDRPEYFIKYKDIIEDFLGTTLEIIEVKMNGNNEKLKLTLKK